MFLTILQQMLQNDKSVKNQKRKNNTNYFPIGLPL
jgi:hypothetical protein